MKRVILKKNLCILLLSVFLFSCGVSFPKETLKEDTEKLIKKEAGVDSKAYLYGTTMYLDVVMEELATQDSQELTEVYKTIQKVVSNVVRVPLSSDYEIKIAVVSVFDSNYNVLLRLYENIDDIKLYSHQLISRTDYEERQLMEIISVPKVKKTIENKHEISLEEYVARLSVSQIGMSAKANPFLGALISKLDLRYEFFKNNTLYFSINAVDNYDVEKLLEKTMVKEIEKNIKKYETFLIKSAILYDKTGNKIFEILFKDINV